MPINAVIFDLDGVITDTEPVHLKAWRYVLKREGIHINDEEYRTNYLGMNDHGFISSVGRNNRRSFSNFEQNELIRRKLQKSLNILRENIPFVPGVEKLISILSSNLPLAICSGSIRQEIDFILKSKCWNKTFCPVITGEDVTEGKPHPQGYMMALSKLKMKNPDLSDDECLAIEDSPKGIAAAKAAGLKCLAIVTECYSEKDLKEADWIAKDFSSIPDDLKKDLGLNGNFN